MNGIDETKRGRHHEDYLVTEEVLRSEKISPFTLRTWRRGWYTDSAGRHYFFLDNSYLEHIWCNVDRRYEYDPIKVGLWTLRLRQKKHENAIAKGKMKKRFTGDSKNSGGAG